MEHEAPTWSSHGPLVQATGESPVGIEEEWQLLRALRTSPAVPL